MSTWHCAATGFVPYFDAIQKDLFRNSGGRVRFRNDDRDGKIYLVASITDPSVNGNALNLHYTGVPTRTPGVTAQLKAISKVPGNPAAIDNIGDGASSANTFVNAGDEEKVNTASIRFPAGFVFNFVNNYYYVIIALERGSDEDVDIDPTAIGVEIIPAV